MMILIPAWRMRRNHPVASTGWTSITKSSLIIHVRHQVKPLNPSERKSCLDISVSSIQIFKFLFLFPPLFTKNCPPPHPKKRSKGPPPPTDCGPKCEVSSSLDNLPMFLTGKREIRFDPKVSNYSPASAPIPWMFPFEKQHVCDDYYLSGIE